MKELIANLIHTALDSLKAAGTLPVELDVQAQVDATRDKTHGDFASNIAMVLSKQARRDPRELAQAIIAALPTLFVYIVAGKYFIRGLTAGAVKG